MTLSPHREDLALLNLKVKLDTGLFYQITCKMRLYSLIYEMVVGAVLVF